MNIFMLDYDPKLSAQYHCDKHVVKMILESAQLLCGARILHNEEAPYKMSKAHLGHPCTKWAAESLDNFEYLHTLALELSDEYSYRYKRTHKSTSVIEEIKPPKSLQRKGITPFARAFNKSLPESIQKLLNDTEDVVEAYRLYYVIDKARFAKWTGRDVPTWFTNNEYHTIFNS